VPPVPLKIKPI
jgi:hypothetical protein